MKLDFCLNGIDAIQKIRSMHYDLVFMDHKMPVMDGIETTQHLRVMGNENVYYKELPIIALTAHAVTGTREMFLENGFNDFLSKPIDTVAMNTVLEKWLPREKQKGSTESSLLVPPQEGIGSIEIEGIDVNRGIFLSGGTVSHYVETLDLFYKDGLEKIKDVKECLATGNLSLYTVHVHALKSASANIGADVLSEEARALEAAGENKDAGFIEKNTDSFLINFELLLNRINSALTELNDIPNEEAGFVNTEMLIPDLVSLKTAIEALDAGTINNIIDSLRELALPKDTSDIIREIYDNLLVAEFDSAVALIDTLIQTEGWEK
jgi:CheY-like chemotaxis protein